jgi:uncharacterized protein (TIGR00299 family) protein
MILHLDFSSGASGDKLLGALLELNEKLGLATFDELVLLAQSLAPDIRVERAAVVNGGICATHIEVAEENPPHRSWVKIRSLIEDARDKGQIDAATTALALRIFENIARAEAEVHQTTLDEVHFHEVGAADSIVDVVGCAWLFSRLAPEAVYATPLVLGFGSFECAHGSMPVPAPATALLIQGLTVAAGPFEGELTTPTGAALSATFVTDFAPLPCVQPLAVGYGAGSRTISGTANVVRALWGQQAALSPKAEAEQAPYTLETVTLIEANIDHRTPEALAFACEQLLELGAKDVWQEPIVMKKGRLAVRLSLLCSPAQTQEFSAAFLRLTGSLGLRIRTVERVVLPRESVKLDTSFGSVIYKAGHFTEDTEAADPDLQSCWLRPEHDEIARIARETGKDYWEIYEQLIKETYLANAKIKENL